jgi:hypothetical protein
MVVQFKRKLYPRGGSYETTIPIQLLFSLDLSKKHDAIFEYDPKSSRWYIVFKESKKFKDKR